MTECQRDVSVPSPALTPRFVNSRRNLLILLGAFFGLHVLIRLMTSRTAGLDESEQLVFAQKWALGYGPQPPLYTWIQILIFKVCGPSILGLSLLKNALLFGCYACTYGVGRIVTRSHSGGLISALGLLFIPQISWESHRELTHSVLAMAVSSATVLTFLKLHERRARRLYLLLGALFGMGMLSNYNYGILLAGLLLAAVCLRDFRPIVLSRWMLVSAAIGVLLLAPHLQWVVQQLPVVLSTSHKLRIRAEGSEPAVAFRAVGNLAGAWLSHIVAVMVIFAALCGKQVARFPREILRRPQIRLLLLLLSIALLGVAVVMVATRATTFKGRWLQPLFFCVSILCAAVVERRMTRGALLRLMSAALVVAVCVMVLLPGRVWFAEKIGRDSGLNAPYAALAQRMQPELERADLIAADSLALGGNLRILMPDKRVITPQFAPWAVGRANQRTAVVFESMTQANSLSPELRQLLSDAGLEMNSNRFRYVEMPPLPGGKKPQRFAVALVP